jgi:hypothetical protein
LGYRRGNSLTSEPRADIGGSGIRDRGRSDLADDDDDDADVDDSDVDDAHDVDAQDSSPTINTTVPLAAAAHAQRGARITPCRRR